MAMQKVKKDEEIERKEQKWGKYLDLNIFWR